jgi:hypothetical protein
MPAIAPPDIVLGQLSPLDWRGRMELRGAYSFQDWVSCWINWRFNPWFLFRAERWCHGLGFVYINGDYA